MATRRAAQTVVRKDIQRVLKEWRGAVKVWCDKLGGDDIPWWYNERSSVSILAVAIWKAGGVALEEYAADKGKKKKHWKGRGDLFIKLNGQKYILEAKQKWVSLSARAQITKERLKSTVKAAKKAVLETKKLRLFTYPACRQVLRNIIFVRNVYSFFARGFLCSIYIYKREEVDEWAGWPINYCSQTYGEGL